MKRLVLVVVMVVAACTVLAGCAKNPFRESAFFAEKHLFERLL